MEIFAGFIIGLLGSFHCIGMCGPIAFALPVFSESKWKVILGRIFYNLGRIITYSLMGALFGLFGQRLILIGLQQQVSIITGIIIVLAVIIPRKFKSIITNTKIYKSFVDSLKLAFSKLYSKKAQLSFLWIGILNGLLPCGFVYVGIAGALTTGDFLSGAAYMALFGLGTFPIMFAASMLGKFLNVNLRRKISKAIPYLALILGFLFIIRGLNLGIPYLSPKIMAYEQPSENSHCH
ncbi:MAG: sulfite exporter TauE/SafE family protein [bacterium]